MAKKPTPAQEPLSRPSSNDEARRVVLDKALSEITKRYGEGAIMRMGEAHSLQVEIIPTGSLSLDLALGVGGIPRGRITEVYGPESSGKTTLCLHMVAECQRMGGTAAYIDMEHALDPVYAARLGVDLDKLPEVKMTLGSKASLDSSAGCVQVPIGNCQNQYKDLPNFVPGCPPPTFLMADEIREMLGEKRKFGLKKDFFMDK
jgi:hypothetical protein